MGAALGVVSADIELVHSLRQRPPYEAALTYFDALNADIAEADGEIQLALTPAELESSLEAGAFAIVPSLEGASSIEGNLDHLRDLHDRGVRVLGLTWNSSNEVAAGVGFEGGLTEFGVEAVALMQELGIVVDLAHASVQTFWDVIERSEGPLLVSHANAKAVMDHPRNLDDEELGALRERGGVIGVVLYPGYVGSKVMA